VNEDTGLQEVDDTDGLDEQAEYEEWKLRELLRIKRDKEERVAYVFFFKKKIHMNLITINININ
jgi:hypothetical protein